MYCHRMEEMPPPILAALADPLRWRLLVELAHSDRRVGELTALLGKPQNLVSYHLAELRAVGVVEARRSSADRRDVYYRADLAACRDQLAATAASLHPALHLPAGPTTHEGRGQNGPRVLFLCTGNSARSQMAEALLVERSGRTIDARSAGSNPKPLHPAAVATMAARGVDISTNASKHLGRFTGMRFDRVITLCDRVRETCPDFPGAIARAHWSIADPAAAEDPAAFGRVADELEARIEILIAELAAPAAERTTHDR